MHFRITYILCFLLLGQVFAQSPNPQIQKYVDEVGTVFSGEKALETTAYVSRFWRLPGNPGFDSSIYYVAKILEKAGFQEKNQFPDAVLSYRIEGRVMSHPAWSPVGAHISLAGEKLPLMHFSSNRNMIAIRSSSTAAEGVEAEVVWLQDMSAKSWQQDMEGKIVFCEASMGSFYRKARQKGAIGAFSYAIPDFNQPEKNDTLVPFSSLPGRAADGGWGIFLSKRAKDALIQKLKAGEKRVRVWVKTEFHDADELCLIAEIQGESRPDQRLVFSAHVQEPGANDNASGVGCQAEMARVAADLWRSQGLRAARTMTFYWGNEISGIHRYLSEDKERTDNILWGISLDMVGEDTEKTGGTFLIEKLPDPSAIWTRGEDEHTEWGAGRVTQKELFPHYLNDFMLNRFLERGKKENWQVKSNPFEGGSDHIPFLGVKKPAVLLWHFTDQYYHTDGDRIDKVSAKTLAHVGISALSAAYVLCGADEEMATFVLREVEQAAQDRLNKECALSLEAMKENAVYARESEILQSWTDWYKGAMQSCAELPAEGASDAFLSLIAQGQRKIDKQLKNCLRQLK